MINSFIEKSLGFNNEIKKMKTSSKNSYTQILHRIFLLGMFVVCAMAVIFFVKHEINDESLVLGISDSLSSGFFSRTGSIDASSLSESMNFGIVENNEKTIPRERIDYESKDKIKTEVKKPISGGCSYVNGSRLTSVPTSLCDIGKVSNFKYSDGGWSWKCKGENGGDDVSCSTEKVVTTPTSPTKTDKSSSAKESTDSVKKSLDSNLSLSQDQLSNSTSTSTSTLTSEKPRSKESETVGSTAETVSNEKEDVIGDTSVVEDKHIIENINNNENADNIKNNTEQGDDQMVKNDISNKNNSGNVEVPEGASDSLPLQNQEMDNIKQAESNESHKEIKNVEINKSTVVAAKELKKEENPKVAGIIDERLKLKTVSIVKKDNGSNKLKLSGKAQPNMLITIYIFSDNPFIITVRTDENGDWSYELDKELENGQHETYIAVSDGSGKILAKSEPIAFVKTAEAATIIPMSELDNNQAPMVRSQNQYIVTALILISIFLFIALAIIGILTYKHHTNERID
jgi:hypothetical protein